MSDANPTRWDWNKAVMDPTSNGARNAVTDPLKLYIPKNWVTFSGGDIRAINVRDVESAIRKSEANTWNAKK